MSNIPTTPPATPPAVDYPQRAKSFAALLGLPARMKPGSRLVLADYPDEETLLFLAPGATLQHHRSLIAAVRDELQSRGATVEFLTLHLRDYYDWLTRFDLQECPQNRAQFVAWCSAPEPKPDPEQPTLTPAAPCQN